MRLRIAVARLICASMVVLVAGLVFSVAALAISPGPAWEISSVAQPTNFSSEDNLRCDNGEFCDRYVIIITNIGSEPTNGSPVVVTDALPVGLKPVTGGLFAQNLENNPPGLGWSCSVADTACTYEGTVASGGTLAVYLEVKVEEPVADMVTNAVTVTGGGAPSVSTSEPLTVPNTVVGPPAAFGLGAFGFAAHDMDGGLDTQAADHPYGVTATVNFNTAATIRLNGAYRPIGAAPPKDLVVYPPLGFIGDPTAAARCTEVRLIGVGSIEGECPRASRVGTVVLIAGTANKVNGSVSPTGAISDVYNMVPDKGYPAQFGFKLAGVPVQVYASLVHTGSGYALRVGTPGIPVTLGVERVALTFFGDPSTADGDPASSQAFLTNPGSCSAGPLTARAEADSWAAPGVWTHAESVAYPQVAGCNLLQFDPAVEMHPQVTQAEEPSGYEIKIKVPQTPERFSVLATPQLKDVTMTLPEGMMLSPGAGDGLTGCEATGPHGFGMPSGEHTPTDPGEGEEIGPDGMTHLTPGHCPSQSQVGMVEVVTPLLESPLEGRVYLAQPRCGGTGQAECTTSDATNGNLFGLYLEAEGAGSVVKLAGSTSVDPTTGRITARFLDNPQLPVSEVVVHLKGGGRAPLANPRQCGEAITTGDLVPWSSPMTPDAMVSSAFHVDWDGNGGSCPGASPFAPTLTAGSTNATAGHLSPFTLTVSRGDRQQDLSRLQVRMPTGLLGLLSKVSLCEEPQASGGTCGEASRIGTVQVAAGSGSHPLWVSGGVYLTGPYAGAPFGLTIVVPAIAGPFNLGNVVVRSRIDIDPNTSQITVTSDPLPQFRDGIPLRIQTLNVAVDREDFLFNPTNCEAKQISATLEAEQGASANVTTPFAVRGCKTLPFKPSFKVSTQAKTSKARGASLRVRVAQRPGEAGISKVQLQLPLALPARLSTLQRACTEAQFNANPAGCPAASVIGTAKAITPVLKVPLVGPAYLVSHGGAAFPDVEFVLQADERGGGVQIVLDGKTQIKKGITYSRFESVPDAPISSFETVLPQGPHSALGTNIPVKAKGSLCKVKLVMPTTLTSQNGAVIKQNTKITVSGCPKAKKAKKAKQASHKNNVHRGRPGQ